MDGGELFWCAIKPTQKSFKNIHIFAGLRGYMKNIRDYCTEYVIETVLKWIPKENYEHSILLCCQTNDCRLSLLFYKVWFILFSEGYISYLFSIVFSYWIL